MTDDRTPYDEAMARFTGDTEPVTYDLGFLPADVPDTELLLGRAAIAMEDTQQIVSNQIAKYLAQAQTNTAMTQTAIGSQLYDQMRSAQEQVRSIQQPIETQLAMQMGRAFEAANQVAPYDSIVRSVVAPQDSANDELLRQASQQAQWVMAAGVGKPSPPGAIPTFPQQPPPGETFPQPTPANPKPGPLFQNFQSLCDWLRANPDVLRPIICDGVHSLVEIARYIDANGQPHYLYHDCGTSAPPYVLKGIQSPTIVEAGPSGVVLFNPSTCTTSQVPPQQPPPPFVPIPPSLPPSQPCPPCPTPQPCPPPPTQPCIKICKDEPTEPCKETEYTAYCSDGGVIYLVEKDDPPRSSGDKKLTTGVGSGINFASLVKECKQKEEQPPGTTPGYGPLGFSLAEGCNGLVLGAVLNPTPDGKYLEHLLTLSNYLDVSTPATGNPVVDTIIELVKTGVGKGVIGGIDKIIAGVVNWITSSGCASPGQALVIASRAVVGLLGRLLGNATEPIDTTLSYQYNSNCPFRLPTSTQATSAYLANAIDLDRLICLVTANGDRWDTWSQLVNAGRSRLNTQETLVGWKRGIITTEWADENLRQLGYLEGPETEILKQLTNQLPPMSDLITMMMRDVADEVNIDWSESDETFGQKWTGQLKEWGDQQGVPNKYAQYVWRAHWTIPAPTQLLEFYRRLRHKGTMGTEQELFRKVRQALIQQDILPQWIPAYIQTSFRPLTRVDTRRAYEISAITRSDVYDSFIDQGYSDENAERLTRFTEAQQIERAKRSPLIRRYATGELTFDDLSLELAQSGFTESQIEIATSKAQRELRYRRRKTCLSAYRKRYLLGEFKFPEIRDKIQSEGIDPSQAEEIALSWECEKTKRGKTVAAQTICEWYTLGVITDVEMYTRLLNLGYTQDDASKLTMSCRIRLGIKIQKDQQKALATAKRRAAEEARAAKAASNQLENEFNKAAKSAEKRRATKQRRQRLLAEAAKKFADRTLISYVDATVGIQTAIDAAIAGNLADIDTIYQISTIVASSEECDTLNCFSRLLGEELIAGALVPSI